MYNLEPPAAASDPTHRTNGSNYFTHDGEMIAHVLILSGLAVYESDPESVVPFTNSLIAERALIWYKMVAVFQGSDAWTYLKLVKKHHDGSMDHKIIYNI